MKKVFLLSIPLCMSWIIAGAQLVLDRQVVSCFAVNTCNEFCIYSTAGQVDCNTSESVSHSVVAGYEQPVGDPGITVKIDVAYNACDQAFEVTITQVTGCADSDSLHFFWNGMEGGMTRTNLPSSAMLVITSPGGCFFEELYDFAQMNLPVEACELDFYSYLSPNGDGSNDTWLIKNITDEAFAKNTVTLMNRWGGKIWEMENYNNVDKAWHGTNQSGEALPDGTYYYVVKANDRSYSGYVELLR